MPRDASGNYTLPAGNPVITGTIIESAWANTTMTDIADALTNSLSRNGQGGMLAAFRVADGTVAAPGVAFTNEPSTGLYRAGAGDFGFSVLGTKRLGLTALLASINSNLSVTSSDINNTAFKFTTAPNMTSGIALQVVNGVGSDAKLFSLVDEFGLEVCRVNSYGSSRFELPRLTDPAIIIDQAQGLVGARTADYMYVRNGAEPTRQFLFRIGPNGELVNAPDADVVPLTIQGVAGQSNHYLSILDSNALATFRVNQYGRVSNAYGGCSFQVSDEYPGGGTAPGFAFFADSTATVGVCMAVQSDVPSVPVLRVGGALAQTQPPLIVLNDFDDTDDQYRFRVRTGNVDIRDRTRVQTDTGGSSLNISPNAGNKGMSIRGDDNATAALVSLRAGNSSTANLLEVVSAANAVLNGFNYEGRLITPETRGALVYRTTDVSIPNAAGVVVGWQAAKYQRGGTWWVGGSPNVLTVPAGVSKVRVRAGVQFDVASGDWPIILTMTGTSANKSGYFRQVASTSNGVSVSAVACSGVIDVAAGNTFSVQVLQASGAALNILAADFTWFEVEVIE